MKIFIHINGRWPLFFALPTRLLLNRYTARIAMQVANRAFKRKSEEDPHMPEFRFSGVQAEALFAECIRLKRRFGCLELVNVHACDGTKVVITL